MRDAFLTSTYEQMVESALSPTYWLLYDASCAEDAFLVGKLYSANSRHLLRKVKVLCLVTASQKDRKAFFEALTRKQVVSLYWIIDVRFW